MATQGNATFGIYVHFPWCLQKCPYCDFLSIAAERAEIPGDAYTEAVLRELAARRVGLPNTRIHSVFFGGGTPSLWAARNLGRVLKEICNSFEACPELEVTVECNPSSFTEAYARELLQVGVTRFSLGVQGLDDARLQFLGRLHDANAGLSAIAQARAAGGGNVSADLIYAVYGQSPEQAVREVERVAASGVQHLSAYTLTIEPGTRFGAEARKGRLPLLSEDQAAQSFEQVDQRLSELGFVHYEISNFAKDGHVSRHNLGYWEGRPYLGLGLGAWGTLPSADGALRYRNMVVPERYLATETWPEPSESATGSGLPYQAFERLSPEVLASERILLGLRLERGLSIARVEQELGVTLLTKERERAIERLSKRGRVCLDGDRLYIPKSTWLLADGTISELL